MARSSLAGRKRVRFELNAEPGSKVFVAGSFNGWDARKNRLTHKNGAYSTTILIPKGRHEYKFVVDGVWCVDPECSEWAPNSYGSLNSVVSIG